MKSAKLLFLSLSLFLLIVLKVEASGLAMGPTSIRIDNAVRGGEYEKYLFIHSTNNGELNLSANVTGNCSDWIYFYLMEDQTKPVTSFIVPANGDFTLLVKFKIPEDTPTGNYSSIIFVQQTPDAVKPSDGNLSSVGIRVRSTADIAVTGNQIITGEIKSVTTADTEINRPLRIKVSFQNTGNVKEVPLIEVDIKKDDISIDKITYSNTTVKVGLTSVIDVEWNTIGQTVGNYTANVKVYLENNMLGEENLNFNILERGTLTAEGSVLSVESQQQIDLGDVAKIDVEFVNTGQIDVIAKISGEVYSNNKIINTLSSDETLVKIGKTETLTAYFKPTEDGTYLVKGNVVYEGKKEPLSDMTINVGSAATGMVAITSPSISEILSNNILIVFIIIIIIIIFVIIYFKKIRESY